MEIKSYLDSTYLKTPTQAGISNSETLEKVNQLTEEAIENHFFAVMIRPDYIPFVRKKIDESGSNVQLGTVISFPEGINTKEEKIREAQSALSFGADELDFVVNYQAFIQGKIELVQEEILDCTQIVLRAGKIVKWIIETAALTDDQIIEITTLIRKTVEEKIGAEFESRVFVKSSTGFFQTADGSPNGANPHVIKLMIENAGNLPVKASGGVRNINEAKQMINLGVKRIGTSSAKAIVSGETTQSGY